MDGGEINAYRISAMKDSQLRQLERQKSDGIFRLGKYAERVCGRGAALLLFGVRSSSHKGHP